MEYTIIDALIVLKPKAEWALDGCDYSGLTWLDKNQTKPTEQEIEVKIAELKYQEEVNVYPVSYTHLTLPTIYSV